jgi:glycosyltransferase involved in cell wall biosynthesis
MVQAIRFSIVIDNYNYARFLPNAIDSCLQQSYPAHEIIVVDDGSTDASRDILLRYQGIEKVKIIFQENKGQAAALQHGFDRATGDWMLGLDSDDYYNLNCLEEISKRIDGKVDWIYFRASVVDVNGVKFGTKPDANVRLMQGETWIPWLINGQFHTFPPQSFHCRSATYLRSVKLYPNRYVDLKTAIWPDTYLHLLSAFDCQAVGIDMELGCYRDHVGGDSKIAFRSFPRIRNRLRGQIMAEEIVTNRLREKGVSTRHDFCVYSTYAYWPERLISLVYDPAGHPHPKDSRIGLLLRILTTYVTRGQLRLLGMARAFLQYAAISAMPKELAWKIYKLPPTRKIYEEALIRLRRRVTRASL